MLKLDNQLCFALYACSREITKLYSPYLDELGITYTQYLTFLVLWEQDNITVKELGRLLHLGTGTLTPLLKKLENEGFINRIRDKVDERNVYLRLTDKGNKMKESAVDIPSKVLCGKDLSIEQVIHLRDELKLLLAQLGD